MTYEEILKLPKGTHLATVNTEKCMIIRLHEGFILATALPGKILLIQRYSEKANLLQEDIVDNIFASETKGKPQSLDC